MLQTCFGFKQFLPDTEYSGSQLVEVTFSKDIYKIKNGNVGHGPTLFHAFCKKVFGYKVKLLSG